MCGHSSISKDLCRDFSDAQSGDLRTFTAAVLTFLPSFVIRHKGHPQLLEDLHGVGIFAPFVADDEDLKRLELQDDTRNGGPQTKTGRRAYQRLQLFTSNTRLGLKLFTMSSAKPRLLSSRPLCPIPVVRTPAIRR